MKRYQTLSEFYCWLLALSLIGIIGIVVGKHECTVGHHTCRKGYTEIYTDTTSTDTLYHCCLTDTPRASIEEKTADSCTASDCVSIPNSNGDLCASIGTRTISSTGRSFTFVEAVRDNCKLHNDQSGLEALCCPQNSTELMLTTLLGAERHEFPHFARLEIKDGLKIDICGGTVYNERFIITASHCVVDKAIYAASDKKKMTIFLDILIEGKSTDNKFGIQEIYIHPNASLTDPNTKRALDNDIALLKLDRDIQFSDRIQALPLAPAGFQPVDFGDTAIIVGFGDTDTLTTSKKLQKADGYIRNTTKSLRIRRYRKHKNDKNQLLFIGGYQDGIASPSGSGGDSGGPAVCRDKEGKAVLCGLTSFGSDMKKECEEFKDEEHCFPTSYVKVDHFRDWIEEVAGTQDNARVMNQPLYGLDVPFDKYPSQVRIESVGGKNDDKSCGGTLIAKGIVLTAAHCVATDDGKMKSNLMVSHKMARGGGIRERVQSIKVLDGFKRILDKNARPRRIAVFAATATWDDPYYKNDLALVKLEKSLKVSSKGIAKLAMAKTQPGVATEVAWVTDHRRRGNLAERQFTLMAHSECQTRMSRLSNIGKNIQVDRNIVCGVENYSGGGKCDRTTGGGLFCGGGNTLCGVQVFRLCEFAVPSAFLDVGMYSDWIQENMKKM